MKFIVFIVRKLKYRFILKLVLSIVLMNSVLMIFMRNPQKESAISGIAPPQVNTPLRKQVMLKEGIYFHIFGGENEVKLAIPFWKMTGVKIQYYVPCRHNTPLPRLTPDNQNIIFYDEEEQRSFKEDISLINEHNINRGQWHIMLNTNVVVNRTAIQRELSKYKWHHPVLLTYSWGRETEELHIFDSNYYEVIIFSASMIELLHSNTNLSSDGFRKYWTGNYLKTDAIITNSFCHQIERNCAFLQNSLFYKVASVDLLPHIFLLLLHSEKRTKSSLLADAARKYDTAFNKVPHKYLHEARELYDREMEWGAVDTKEWKRMNLPQECKELGLVNRPDCYLSCLVEGSMPIIRNGGMWQWRIVEAYTQFSLEVGEEYLVWLEKRGGHNFLFRFMSPLAMNSGGDLLVPVEQKRLFLLEDGELHSEGILDRYQDLLREQEVHLTTTRHPMLFTIDLTLLIDQLTEDTLTQQLNRIKAVFPEIEAEICNGKITSINLSQLVSHLELNDILAVNILKKNLDYQTIERCFSLPSLELFMASDNDGGACITVGDAIRTIKLESGEFSLESISKLLSDMKLMRIPISLAHDGI